MSTAGVNGLSTKTAYIIGICTVIFLTVFNQFLIQRILNEQKYDATVINLAGRQRMLSQKIAKEAYQATIDRDLPLQTLKDDLELWTRVHTGLQYGDETLGLPENRSDSVASLFNEITPYQRAIADAVNGLESEAEIADIVPVIVENESRFLPLMDEIVDQLERESREDTGTLIILEIILAFFSIGILVLEVQFIFRPLYTSLKNDNERLEILLKDLSESKGELFKSVQRYNLSLQAINAGIWDWFIPSGEEWWSAKFYELLGYDKGDLEPGYYTLIDYLLHPDDKKKMEKGVDDHLKKRIPFKLEIRMKCKSGEYRWFESVGQANWGEEGEPLRMVGSIIDIDDRKQLESQLQRDKQFLNVNAKEKEQIISLLEETQRVAKIGSWEVDIQKMTCYWSDEVYRIHEVPVDTPISVEEGINYYREDFRPVIQKAVEEGIANNENWDEECILVTQKGNEVWVRAIGYPVIENGEVKLLRGLFMEIDAEKRAFEKNTSLLEQLKTSERQLKKFVKQAPVAVAMLDTEMRYISVSDKWLEDYGLKDKGLRVTGKSHYEVFPEIKQMPEWLSIHKEVLAGKQKSTPRDKFVRSDGSIQWIRWKLIPWYDNPGEVGGMIMYTSDITNEVEYQDKLENLNEVLEFQVKKRTEELNYVNNELEAFSYSVSHDLRAPLRSVNGFADILEEDYGHRLDDEGLRILRIIKSSGIKMGKLIDDILNFSRLGRQDIQKNKVDMHLLTEDVIKQIELVNGNGRLSIDVEDLPQVYGDIDTLKQVLTNLISNAVKYSSHRDKIKVEISCEEKNDRYVFKITDNGAGFDMKYHDQLFGVFQRLHTSEEFEGTGVGLAIVKRVITKHGGNVWAESKVDKGSAFYFSLPKN